jgi:DNA-binding transcriptional ArsR family regulator
MSTLKLKKRGIEVEMKLGEKASFNLKALYHPMRKRLLVLIEKKGKASISDIYTELHLAQSIASQHLAILRKAGIVNAQRDGKNIFYSVNIDRISEIESSARALVPTDKKADKGGVYLANRPKIESVTEQLQKQWLEKGKKNHLSEIIGTWPGDETFESLSKQLTK